MSDQDIERVLSNVLERYIPKIAAASSAAVADEKSGGSIRYDADLEALRLALKEAQVRQNKSTEETKSLHRKQLEILRAAISDERREAAEVHKHIRFSLMYALNLLCVVTTCFFVCFLQ